MTTHPGTGDPGTVEAALPRLFDALGSAGCAVLVAPPGSGKTTLVPPALARHRGGRVVVAEPRRIAVRAAARRIAHLLGEPVGRQVGYTVRGESRTGPKTRVEIVTTGVLVQRLQRDPELPGVTAVVVDECHERHLETDLALAFTADVRSVLRDDLLLLAMSATAQADRLAAALTPGGSPDGSPGGSPGGSPDGSPGGSAPVVRVDGAGHDVRVVWCPPPGPVDPPDGLRVDPRLLDHVAAVVRRALDETGPDGGDVLVFLPGTGEIGAVARRLASRADADVVPLHGRLPAAAQDDALRERPGRRRVVLATSVAESSLTVPGVRTVVDAGLARVPRTDLARGLGSLVTVPVSQAAATQRAGRAGRLGPGTAYRCWSEAVHQRLRPHPEPAVATADLTAFALHLACWGTPDGTGLALLDPPPEASLRVARETLRDLGATDASGALTPRGRDLAAVGVHPRLARALLDGGALVGARRAAEVVALLSGGEGGGPAGSGGDDLAAVWRDLRRAGHRPDAVRWRDETARLTRSLPGTTAPGATRPSGTGPSGTALPDDLAAATVVGLAFPERLARLRRAEGRSYLMASGTAAELGEGSSLRGSGWLAIAVADRDRTRRDARIRLAVPVDEATACEVAAPLLSDGEEVTWADGDVRARATRRLGAIVLAERRLDRPDPALVAAAVADGLRREGLDLLPWTPAATALRARLAACRAGLGDPWPAVDDDAVLAALDLSRVRGRADLRRIDLVTLLRGLLPWQLSARLDEVAPQRLELPGGTRATVDYADPAGPTLSVRVQAAFGWTASPTVAGHPLRVQLLSPAGRPVAVTGDLASFWRTGYPAVRAELRGRYPRHPWPEDPTHPAPRRT